MVQSKRVITLILLGIALYCVGIGIGVGIVWVLYRYIMLYCMVKFYKLDCSNQKSNSTLPFHSIQLSWGAACPN